MLELAMQRIVLPGLLALGIAGAVMGLGYWSDVKGRSELPSPDRVVTPDRAELDTAAALLYLRSLSKERHSITPEVRQADREAFIEHVNNIAVARGWFPHSLSEHGVELIVPSEELSLLSWAEARPYDWVGKHTAEGETDPPPVSWDSPAYVSVQTRPSDWGKAKAAMAGGIFAAVIAFLITLAWGNSMVAARSGPGGARNGKEEDK